MWKMLVGFIVFAVLAVYLLMKSGADVDMSGEKHGVDATHVEDSKTSEAPASAAPVASAASN